MSLKIRTVFDLFVDNLNLPFTLTDCFKLLFRSGLCVCKLLLVLRKQSTLLLNHALACLNLFVSLLHGALSFFQLAFNLALPGTAVVQVILQLAQFAFSLLNLCKMRLSFVNRLIKRVRNLLKLVFGLVNFCVFDENLEHLQNHLGVFLLLDANLDLLLVVG